MVAQTPHTTKSHVFQTSRKEGILTSCLLPLSSPFPPSGTLRFLPQSPVQFHFNPIFMPQNLSSELLMAEARLVSSRGVTVNWDMALQPLPKLPGSWAGALVLSPIAPHLRDCRPAHQEPGQMREWRLGPRGD